MPGRRLVTTTSTVAATASTWSRPAGSFRSITTLRLFRSRLRAIPDSWGTGPAVITRLSVPFGSSTVITSAPRSPRIWVARGPMTTVLRSSTRTPCSGPRGVDDMVRSFGPVPGGTPWSPVPGGTPDRAGGPW